MRLRYSLLQRAAAKPCNATVAFGLHTTWVNNAHQSDKFDVPTVEDLPSPTNAVGDGVITAITISQNRSDRTSTVIK